MTDIQSVSGRKKNELQEFSNLVNKKKRKHLQGEKEKENQLLQRVRKRRISYQYGFLNAVQRCLLYRGNLLEKKAVIVHRDLKLINPDIYGKMFEASNGWLFKFMKRHNLSLRRQTSVAQKDPDLLTAKIV